MKNNYYKHSSIYFKNYIYLKYYNYLKYSAIAPETFFNSYASSLQTNNFLNRNIDINTKQQIEQYLNTFFPQNRNGALNSQVSEETWKKIATLTEQKFREKYSSYNIDWTTLRASKTLENEFDQAFGEAENFSKQYLAPWHKKIQKLTAQINSLPNDNRNSKALREQARLVNQLWLDIINTVPGATVAQDGIAHGIINANNASNFMQFQKAYNELNNMLYGYGQQKTDSQASGYLLEVFIAAAMLVMSQEVYKETGNILDNMLVGGALSGSHHGIQVSAQGALSHKQWEDIVGRKLKNYNGDLYSMQVVQGKSDINFTLKGIDINASIKNYNVGGKHDISLVSKSPLRDLIQKDADFLCHYLNVLSEHGYESWENAYEPAFYTKSLAHNTMRKLIFCRSLIGGGYYEMRRNLTKGYSAAVDLFILNDNRQGRIKVYYVDEIISKVLQDINLMSIASNIKGKRSDGTEYQIQGYPNNNQYTYNINGWKQWLWYPPRGDYGRRRRAHLYKQLQNIKIVASVNLDVFKMDFGYPL